MNSKIQLSKEELRENKPARDEYLGKPKTPLIVLLDHVTNSYNIGSFIRLADAFAIEKIIVCGE
ncbi:MAG: RNA methyltransferase, partial [Alteromonadales bacterium]|nr:RNA methyltransferase [Alteromonadales bacterium]